MKTLESKLEYLFSVNPSLSDNNTEVCLALWEYVAKARGVYEWYDMKSIIREYPPESITRARRKLTESTDKQREKQEEYMREYANRAL